MCMYDENKTFIIDIDNGVSPIVKCKGECREPWLH